VVFHLKNAMRKIGVYSKHHAVVKAIMMGLIHP
jgi:DNA-binding CsgD family transcriptional regulator